MVSVSQCITLHYMDDQLSFRIPRELVRALRRTADERGVPKSQLVREALQAYLMAPAPGRSAEPLPAHARSLIGSVRLDRAAAERDELAARIRRHNWRD